MGTGKISLLSEKRNFDLSVDLLELLLDLFLKFNRVVKNTMFYYSGYYFLSFIELEI